MRISDWSSDVCSSDLRTAAAERRALFDRVARMARRRRLVLMLGGTAAQARAWRADGWHGRDRRLGGKMLLHSRPVHDKRQMAEAARAGADFVFLSPLFPTRSHPGSLVLGRRSEEHTSELQSLMRISYAVFCLKKK